MMRSIHIPLSVVLFLKGIIRAYLNARPNAAERFLIRPSNARKLLEPSANSGPAIILLLAAYSPQGRCVIPGQILVKWAEPSTSEWRTFFWTAIEQFKMSAQPRSN